MRDQERLLRLEYLRGAASLYVFFHHFVRLNLPELPGVARFFVFGQAAVLLFFLLSGFVVHYATVGQGGEPTFRGYFTRRFRRIYPTYFLALVASYAAACVLEGRLVDPLPRELFVNLALWQDRARAGNWATPYMGNSPLWSLSYEWWFYMAYFAVLRLTRNAKRATALGLVFAIALLGTLTDIRWPNPVSHVASYFVLWWLGVEMAREYIGHRDVTLRRQAPALLAAASITAIWVMVAVQSGVSGAGWYEHPGLTTRHFLTTMGMVAIGWGWKAARFVAFDRLLKWFGVFAPLSYALYVLHLPMLLIAVRLGASGYGTADLVWMGPLIFLLCWVVEQPLQRRINRWLPSP
ncbi:MAG: acyltransferase [Myxococcales bacterium]|nr:acyltransferase [Myxococcales bacterium]